MISMIGNIITGEPIYNVEYKEFKATGSYEPVSCNLGNLIQESEYKSVIEYFISKIPLKEVLEAKSMGYTWSSPLSIFNTSNEDEIIELYKLYNKSQGEIKMRKAIVKFKNNKKYYMFNTEDLNLVNGDNVLVETSQGNRKGAFLNYVHDSNTFEPTKSIIRKLNHNDSKEDLVKQFKVLIGKPLTITDEVYDWYINSTIGNKNVSREQAELKLTRNVILGEKIGYNKVFNRIYKSRYGTLMINVKGNEIVLIERTKLNKEWEKDKELYNYINYRFGIKD